MDATMISHISQKQTIIVPQRQSMNNLECLYGVETILVKQKKEMMEIFTGWESNNRFEVRDVNGQIIMYAVEDTDAGLRCCLGEDRPFTINMLTTTGIQTVRLQADIDLFTQNVSVQIPPGRPFAKIYKEFALLCPSFYVSDANDDSRTLFRIDSGASAVLGSFGSVKFDIKGADGKTVIGRISKRWSGLSREFFTDADYFGVSMPADMSVQWKAVLLAVLFHIDMTFYEKNN